MELAFHDCPYTARGHLGLLLHQAVYHLIHHLQIRAEVSGKDLEQVFTEFPYLQPYFNEVRSRLPEEIDWPSSLRWLAREIDAWENAATVALPLRNARVTLGLDRVAILTLVLLGAVEESASFTLLFSEMQSDDRHRPGMELLQAVLAGSGEADDADAWDLCRPLLDCGMVEILNRDEPRSEWQLRVPGPIWSAIRGDSGSAPAAGLEFHPPSLFSEVADLIVPEAQRAQLVELVPLMKSGRASALIVRGLPGSDRMEVAGSVAAGTGRGLMIVPAGGKDAAEERWRLIGPLCTLTAAMPAFCLDLSPGETFELPALRGYRGPIAVILGAEGGLSGLRAESAVSFYLEAETEQDRLLQWKHALNGNTPENVSELAETFCLQGRYIRQSAQLATAYAALDRRTTITSTDVRQAVRAINRQSMDSLATRLETGSGWGQIVVRASTADNLRDLERRCRHRERISVALSGGMPGGLNRGVRALFEGPSGTGKTLGARALAGVLQLDIYRVDLASVVNKYIGETEKNLSRVLSRAEDLNVVLLLDEGDALMTRRTDVKSANDRYANLETNYLLQRLDTYGGILIVTTNAGNYIDSAFRRRMDVVVTFHLPDATERWRLWQLHLPERHQVGSAAIEEIALRYTLTGGQIRNAAIHALMLAIDRGDALVSDDDVHHGVQSEYLKAGAPFPERQAPGYAIHEGALAGFLGAIS